MILKSSCESVISLFSRFLFGCCSASCYSWSTSSKFSQLLSYCSILVVVLVVLVLFLFFHFPNLLLFSSDTLLSTCTLSIPQTVLSVSFLCSLCSWWKLWCSCLLLLFLFFLHKHHLDMFDFFVVHIYMLQFLQGVMEWLKKSLSSLLRLRSNI